MNAVPLYSRLMIFCILLQICGGITMTILGVRVSSDEKSQVGAFLKVSGPIFIVSGLLLASAGFCCFCLIRHRHKGPKKNTHYNNTASGHTANNNTAEVTTGQRRPTNRQGAEPAETKVNMKPKTGKVVGNKATTLPTSDQGRQKLLLNGPVPSESLI